MGVPLKEDANDKGYIDIHAGAVETSWMLLNYTDLANAEIARQQKCTSLSIEELKSWLCGGEIAKNLTPLGYCGNPSDIDLDSVRMMECSTVAAFADCIRNKIE